MGNYLSNSLIIVRPDANTPIHRGRIVDHRGREPLFAKIGVEAAKRLLAEAHHHRTRKPPFQTARNGRVINPAVGKVNKFQEIIVAARRFDRAGQNTNDVFAGFR